MKENRSIIQDKNDTCYVCGCGGELHLHHVFFGTSCRKKSDEDGMLIYLCPAHHNMSSQGIHFNDELDDKIKQQAQRIWMSTYCDEDDSEEKKIFKFRKRYGKNYL